MRPLVLLALAGAAVGCRAEAPDYWIELGGRQRIRFEDDPTFASPERDETGFRRVTPPATWRPWIDGDRLVAWHRIRFVVDGRPPSERLALDLGHVSWSDETFLDGRRLGATGSFRIPSIGYRPRLYPIRAELLQPGEHVLAIRVRGVPMTSGGLFATRLGIGDELELSRAHDAALARCMAAEALLLGFLGFAWMLAAFFPKRGRAGRATFFLLASITVQIVHLFLVSQLGRHVGATGGVGANVIFVLVGLAACGFWSFVATILRGSLPRVLVVLIAVAGVVMVVFLAAPGTMQVPILVALAVSGAGLLTIARLIVAAVRARTPGAVAMLLGVATMGSTTVAMFVVRDPFVQGLGLFYYALAVVNVAAVVALTRYVRALDGQAERAAQYALQAHTRERGRMARDIHDGLGQMLALLKMQMQRLARKHEGAEAGRAFDDGAQAVAATIDELRRVARDLRPAPLQDRSFGAAVREYAAAMAQRTDIEVVVDGDYGSAPGEEVAAEASSTAAPAGSS
jgi:signal transduction histidine kinase